MEKQLEFKKVLLAIVGLGWIFVAVRMSVPEKFIELGFWLVVAALGGQIGSDVFGKGKLIAAARLATATSTPPSDRPQPSPDPVPAPSPSSPPPAPASRATGGAPQP